MVTTKFPTMQLIERCSGRHVYAAEIPVDLTREIYFSSFTEEGELATFTGEEGEVTLMVGETRWKGEEETVWVVVREALQAGYFVGKDQLLIEFDPDDDTSREMWADVLEKAAPIWKGFADQGIECEEGMARRMALCMPPKEYQDLCALLERLEPGSEGKGKLWERVPIKKVVWTGEGAEEARDRMKENEARCLAHIQFGIEDALEEIEEELSDEESE